MTDAPRGPTTEELRARVLAQGKTAPYRYDRREISLWSADPLLHATDCPDAPPDAHAVGFWPHPGTRDVAAAAVALRSHSCVPGAEPPLDKEKGERLGSPGSSSDQNPTRDPGR